jgi:hypothetical protein
MGVVLVAVLLAGAPAQARFGKRSSPPPPSSSGSSHGGGIPNSYHPAYVGGGQSTGYVRGPAAVRPWFGRSYYCGAYVPWGGYGYGYASAAPVLVGGAASAAPDEGDEGQVRISADLDATGVLGRLSTSPGYTAGLTLAIEGERLGLNLSAMNIGVAANDGSGGIDNLQNLSAYVSYAVLAGPQGKLRVEGGLSTYFAPDVVMIAPALALSGTVALVGPVAAEASVRAAVFPFIQVDARAGLVVGLGRVGVRAGWRHLYLNDRGVLGQGENVDIFSGPYVGIGIAF